MKSELIWSQVNCMLGCTNWFQGRLCHRRKHWIPQNVNCPVVYSKIWVNNGLKQSELYVRWNWQHMNVIKLCKGQSCWLQYVVQLSHLVCWKRKVLQCHTILYEGASHRNENCMLWKVEIEEIYKAVEEWAEPAGPALSFPQCGSICESARGDETPPLIAIRYYTSLCEESLVWLWHCNSQSKWENLSNTCKPSQHEFEYYWALSKCFWSANPDHDCKQVQVAKSTLYVSSGTATLVDA